MKLVLIEHIRCHEAQAVDLVWVAEDMDGSQLEQFIIAGRRAFEQMDADARKIEAPQSPAMFYEYIKKYPDLTVREVTENYEKEQKDYSSWRKRMDALQLPFVACLEIVSEGKILAWKDERCAFIYPVDWGHQHGRHLKYGTSFPWDRKDNA